MEFEFWFFFFLGISDSQIINFYRHIFVFCVVFVHTFGVLLYLWLCLVSDFTEQIKMLLERQETLYERKSELKALLEASKENGDNAENCASVTAENWSGSFEWDSQADDVRFNVFGISTYRANQREVSVLSGILIFLKTVCAVTVLEKKKKN